jgi:hypothetical protein
MSLTHRWGLFPEAKRARVSCGEARARFAITILPIAGIEKQISEPPGCVLISTLGAATATISTAEPGRSTAMRLGLLAILFEVLGGMLPRCTKASVDGHAGVRLEPAQSVSCRRGSPINRPEARERIERAIGYVDPTWQRCRWRSRRPSSDPARAWPSGRPRRAGQPLRVCKWRHSEREKQNGTNSRPGDRDKAQGPRLEGTDFRATGRPVAGPSESQGSRYRPQPGRRY